AELETPWAMTSPGQFGIGEDQLAQGRVIADIAGAAADMPVHCRENARLDLGLRHRRARKALEEHLRLVDEARRAVAALEGEMVEEGGLHRRQLALPGDALDGANGFVGEEIGAG